MPFLLTVLSLSPQHGCKANPGRLQKDYPRLAITILKMA
jgi:hypothetical protein